MSSPEHKHRCRVIAHRGASAYLPEHTLAAYALAIRQGADYIEPDLVMSADGVLLARHDQRLSVSTDFARHPELAGRAGQDCCETFRLAELVHLRAIEPMPEARPHGRRYDGLLKVPTLQQIIDLLRRMERETGRVVGLCPELKIPAHFAAQGLDMAGTLLDQLASNGYSGADAPVWLQCFDADVLRGLSTHTDLPLMQLLEPQGEGDLPVPLTEIAGYARAIGPRKDMLLAGEGRLVRDAHAAGLEVYPWVVDGQDADELRRVMATGVEGFFCNEPDRAVAACAGGA